MQFFPLCKTGNFDTTHDIGNGDFCLFQFSWHCSCLHFIKVLAIILDFKKFSPRELLARKTRETELFNAEYIQSAPECIELDMYVL